jgi:hypothetical protein
MKYEYEIGITQKRRNKYKCIFGPKKAQKGLLYMTGTVEKI